MTLIYTQQHRESSDLVDQWIKKYNPMTTRIKTVSRDSVSVASEWQSQEDWFETFKQDGRNSQVAYKDDGLSKNAIRESRMIDVVDAGGKRCNQYRQTLISLGYSL